MAEAFKTGDIVQLKSGGPAMTIVKYGDYSGDQKVLCRWFDGKSSSPVEHTFFEAELKAVPQDTGGHESGPQRSSTWG